MVSVTPRASYKGYWCLWAQRPPLLGDLINIHRGVSQLEGATTSIPVRKSIHHLPKALPITHPGFVTSWVQGLALEVVYFIKCVWMWGSEVSCLIRKLAHDEYNVCCSHSERHAGLSLIPRRETPQIVWVCFTPLCVCYCWKSSWSVALNLPVKHSAQMWQKPKTRNSTVEQAHRRTATPQMRNRCLFLGHRLSDLTSFPLSESFWSFCCDCMNGIGIYWQMGCLQNPTKLFKLKVQDLICFDAFNSHIHKLSFWTSLSLYIMEISRCKVVRKLCLFSAWFRIMKTFVIRLGFWSNQN